MSHYFIANIKIKNSDEYKKYLNEAGEIFSKYNGKYLAVDDKPLILEGSWNYTRTVLIEFNTKEDFEQWYNSDEYQRILKYRLNASECDTILVSGD